MKFNKPLHIQLIIIFSFALLVGCSSTPEQTAGEEVEKSGVEKSTKKRKQKDDEGGGSPQVVGVAPASSALPPGPATPNPYLLVKPKLNPQVEANFTDAVAAIQQKNWARAESLLQHLATTNPGLSGVHLNLGIVHRGKGDTAKAADAFNRAITANPKNVDAYNQLAVIKRESGDFTAAEILYKKALAAWPFYPEGHKNLAILYELYMGKPEQALPHYQAYQQLLAAPDKQVDSWIADLQRRLNGGKAVNKDAENAEAK
jgi:tetratricopeptide (TPR) repeat protein